MKHTDIDSIYNEITLLSDADRDELYYRVKENFYQNSIVAYTATHKPLTKKQYIEKIERAIEEANKGELLKDEDLQKEIEIW